MVLITGPFISVKYGYNRAVSPCVRQGDSKKKSIDSQQQPMTMSALPRFLVRRSGMAHFGSASSRPGEQEQVSGQSFTRHCS